MNIRRLKPCTIIPPELYVIREADKQLRNVIEDMGRPGYILVARQMGKTNLLLNAKRVLEDKNNALIYIDLSAPFASERECFRHIIDTAIETRPDCFEKCGKTILEARKGALSASYKEHENELRFLLGSITGKVVIILDEIDSLTKGNFSDKIFAQIRSVYFTRMNYPQFNRLTYVLSGVVEPNEIIKDKRISPFNIGEKIYLDDFTFDQFLDFLSRADLSFKKETIDRIYFWASGNPRLTWDICLDLDEKLATGHFITPEEVDDSVKKLYLTDFTKAPIDHIREVAATDDELRSAITVIKYGKGYTLPDATKSRLYLAGIIRSVASDKNVKIKNKIIDHALSDQWLLDISIKIKGLYKMADERYRELKYGEALNLYEQYIQSPGISNKDKEAAYWYMGLSAYHVGDYQKALTYLRQTNWDKDVTGILYYENQLYRGLSYLQIGDIATSRAHLEEALETPKKESTYFNALINLGTTYSAEKDFLSAIKIYQKALLELESYSEHSGFKVSALYSLGNTYSKMEDRPNSRMYFQKALEASSLKQRPAVILGLYRQLDHVLEKERLLNDCLELIISNKIHPDTALSEETLNFSNSTFYAILTEAYSLSRPIFDRLFAFANTLEEMRNSNAGFLVRLAYIFAGSRDFDSAIGIARDIVEKPVHGVIINQDAAFHSYRLLCLFCKGKERQKYQVKYVDCLNESYIPKSFDVTDLEIFVDIAANLIKAAKPITALEYINIAKRYKALLPADQISDYAALHFYEMLALKNANSLIKVKRASVDALEFLKECNGPSKNSHLVKIEGLKNIEEFAKSNLVPEQTVLESSAPEPLDRRPGRNQKVSVRYQDGTIKTDIKYKKIEKDLAEQRCVLFKK
jgi:hypothetical protein